MAALLLIGCATEEILPIVQEDNYTIGIYELTFKTKKISNNFVGNDWSFSYSHNGIPIDNGYQIPLSLELFTFQTIDIEIREQDKIDDVGNGVMYVAICDGGSGKAEITVTETDGRYKGNAAIWEVSCEVKLVDKK